MNEVQETPSFSSSCCCTAKVSENFETKVSEMPFPVL